MSTPIEQNTIELNTLLEAVQNLESIIVDQTLSATSTNPISNKAVTEAINALKTTVVVDATSGSKTFTVTPDNTNQENRYLYASGINNLTINSNGSFLNNSEGFWNIVFISGTTAVTFVNNVGVYFSGDDCINGTFNPVANRTYDLGIWWNGIDFQGVVGGN